MNKELFEKESLGIDFVQEYVHKNNDFLGLWNRSYENWAVGPEKSNTFLKHFLLTNAMTYEISIHIILKSTKCSFI